MRASELTRAPLLPARHARQTHEDAECRRPFLFTAEAHSHGIFHLLLLGPRSGVRAGATLRMVQSERRLRGELLMLRSAASGSSSGGVSPRGGSHSLVAAAQAALQAAWLEGGGQLEGPLTGEGSERAAAMLVVLALPAAVGFFRRLGFEAIDDAALEHDRFESSVESCVAEYNPFEHNPFEQNPFEQNPFGSCLAEAEQLPEGRRELAVPMAWRPALSSLGDVSVFSASLSSLDRWMSDGVSEASFSMSEAMSEATSEASTRDGEEDDEWLHMREPVARLPEGATRLAKRRAAPIDPHKENRRPTRRTAPLSHGALSRLMAANLVR